ncbi:MAG TPA: hypothetical protein V6C81_04150 [Planktothrix sp.]
MHTHHNRIPTSYVATLKRSKKDAFAGAASFATAIVIGGTFWQNNAIGQAFSSVLITLPIIYAVAMLIANLPVKTGAKLVATFALTALAICVVHLMMSASSF